jgi:hypothetical protein
MIRALDGSSVQLGGLGLGGQPPKIVGGTLSTSGSGAIQIVSGGLQDVTLEAGSTLKLSPGSFLTLARTLTNDGNFGLGIAPGNTHVAVNGNVTVSGTGVWQMTPISNNSITGVDGGAADVPDVLTNEVSHTIQGTGVIGQFGGLSFINKGLVDGNHPNGLTIRGDGSTITNLGTMRASGGGNLNFWRSALTNTGKVEALNGSTVTMHQFNAALLNVSAGGILSGGTYRSIDGGAGASMTMTSATVNTIAAGTTVEMSGAGAVMKFGTSTNLAVSLVNNAGTLKLHNDHKFNMTNSYTQAATGNLEFELASLTSVAMLTTGGSATLSGTLGVLLGGGFMPAASDVFTVVDAGSLSGTFSNVANGQRLDALGADGSFLVTYNAGAGTVVLSNFLAVELPGDFNFDGKVDGADYVVWRKNAMAPEAFNTWRANFGATAGSASSINATVPEPATALLLVLGVALKSRKARRRMPSPNN